VLINVNLTRCFYR